MVDVETYVELQGGYCTVDGEDREPYIILARGGQPVNGAEQKDDWIPLDDMADQLKVFPASLERWVQKGELQGQLIDGQRYVRRSEMHKAERLGGTGALETVESGALTGNGQPMLAGLLYALGVLMLIGGIYLGIEFSEVSEVWAAASVGSGVIWAALLFAAGSALSYLDRIARAVEKDT